MKNSKISYINLKNLINYLNPQNILSKFNKLPNLLCPCPQCVRSLFFPLFY